MAPRKGSCLVGTRIHALPVSGDTEPAGLACSPKVDPVVVRVSTAREPGKEAQDERQATHSGPDHRQAA